MTDTAGWRAGYAGEGGKREPAGVIHKGEYVVPADVVWRAEVKNLEMLRPSYANGGPVGMPVPSIPSASDVRATGTSNVVTVAPQTTIQMNGSGTPEQTADQARQVGGQVEGAMRNVVRQKLQAQMRAGGMLNARFR